MNSEYLKDIPSDLHGLLEMLPRWQEFVKELEQQALDEEEMAERVFGKLVREVFKNDPPEMFASNRSKRRRGLL